MPSSDTFTQRPASPVPSALPSLVNTDTADAGDRSIRDSITSLRTNETTLSEFYAAVATTPPSLEDWAAYPFHEVEAAATREPTRPAAAASDSFPDQESLDLAGQLIVYDGLGRAKSFKALCQTGRRSARRQLIVLIRHFYCQACQFFVKTLKSLLSNTPDDETDIILIGCGHPSFINDWVARTGCPFPVYTDPSLNLHKMLKCSRFKGLRFGPKTEYTKAANAGEIGRVSLHHMFHGWPTPRPNEPESSPPPRRSERTWNGPSTDPTPRIQKRCSIDKMRAGPLLAVGGEFLFEHGKLIWCHRMNSIRGHAEPRALRKMLYGEKRTTVSATTTDMGELSERLEYVMRSPPVIQRSAFDPTGVEVGVAW